MGKLVSIMATSHAPGIVSGWPSGGIPKERNDAIQKALSHLRIALHAAEPDTLIGIANDHLLNFYLENLPQFAVGIGAEHCGPAEWFANSTCKGVAPYRFPGNPDLARQLVQKGQDSDINFAVATDLLYDDNFSVPLHFLQPPGRFVPLLLNCHTPPQPSPDKCFELGRVLRDFVENDRPAYERVALLATGGMSHDAGGPRFGFVDEQFDRRFMSLLDKPAQMLREITLDSMAAAGQIGTTELLAWFVTLGAVGTGKVTFSCYECVPEWASGIGMAIWDLNGSHLPEQL